MSIEKTFTFQYKMYEKITLEIRAIHEESAMTMLDTVTNGTSSRWKRLNLVKYNRKEQPQNSIH